MKVWKVLFWWVYAELPEFYHEYNPRKAIRLYRQNTEHDKKWTAIQNKSNKALANSYHIIEKENKDLKLVLSLTERNDETEKWCKDCFGIDLNELIPKG